MNEENDVNALVDVIRFLAAIGGAYIKANEDGSVDLKDVFLLGNVVPTIWPVLDSIDEIPAELSDLNDEEITFLANVVKEVIELEDEEKEVVYETIIISAIKFVNELRSVIVALKAAKGIIDMKEFAEIFSENIKKLNSNE